MPWKKMKDTPRLLNHWKHCEEVLDMVLSWLSQSVEDCQCHVSQTIRSKKSTAETVEPTVCAFRWYLFCLCRMCVCVYVDILVGGLQHVLIFPYIGNNHPNWLVFICIYQRGRSTTNQLCIYHSLPLHRFLWTGTCRQFQYGGRVEEGAGRWSLKQTERIWNQWEISRILNWRYCTI